MKIGDRVQVIGLPGNLSADDDEVRLNTSTVFKSCLGRVFSIVGFNEIGHAELEVGEAAGQEPYMQSIWIEPKFLSLMTGSG